MATANNTYSAEVAGESVIRDGAPVSVTLSRPRRMGQGTAGIETIEDLEHAERLALIREGRLGTVHSWELVTAVDGPGTRMTTFFSGCPLRCLYCHNPDTMQAKDGDLVSADEILGRIRRYVPLFKATGGGVTFSGGEPLMQPAFLATLLSGAKGMGLHTAVDTSGNLGRKMTDGMLEDVDLVLLDVKSGDPDTYKRVTGRELQPTIDFGRRLSESGTEIWARFVLVPGLTDDPDNVRAVAEYVSTLETVSRLEVLPFHQMGRDKWTAIGMKYELEDVLPPSLSLIKSTREIFAEYGLQVY